MSSVVVYGDDGRGSAAVAAAQRVGGRGRRVGPGGGRGGRGVRGGLAHRAHRADHRGCAVVATTAADRVLGIDETRARRVRWLLEPAGWRRSDPWLTSFVDVDTTGLGMLQDWHRAAR